MINDIRIVQEPRDRDGHSPCSGLEAQVCGVLTL